MTIYRTADVLSVLDFIFLLYSIKLCLKLMQFYKITFILYVFGKKLWWHGIEFQETTK